MSKYPKKLLFVLILILGGMPLIAYAVGNNAHTDPIAPVIFAVTLLLCCAFFSRLLARHFNQPTVLGELLMGVAIGNILYYFNVDLIVVLREGTASLDIGSQVLSGLSWEMAAINVLGESGGRAFLDIVQSPNGAQTLQVAQAIDVFSRYGVIFLLFHVGLSIQLSELRQVGMDAIRVALLGVIAPFVLGMALIWILLPESSNTQQIFLAATLCATSIGITARVLVDLQKEQTHEAHVILGAAVIDDVLGLLMLAIAAAIAVTGSIAIIDVVQIILLALLFLIGVLLISPQILRFVIWSFRHLDLREVKLFIPFIFVMLLAWLANLVGLATIVGAFAAGLILQDKQFKYWGNHMQHKYSIQDLFSPLESILVPIFFVLMGIQVKLETFMDWQVIFVAIGLLVVAIVGKLVSGWGANKKANRLAIGIGMMPRGEVGLVFASVGKSLGVLSTSMFSAIVLMVIITTLLTPPLLKVFLSRND